MKNHWPNQRCLSTACLRATVLLLALAGGMPALRAQDAFADKPPTLDELHARRLYQQYKSSKTREAELKASIKDLNDWVLANNKGYGATEKAAQSAPAAAQSDDKKPITEAGADQPATKPTDKSPVKEQPSTPTPKDGPLRFTSPNIPPNDRCDQQSHL